ncbi:hypothetical protein JST99_05455 [Candidatus Dependentiae bacterium]|nr:hypothetical protein [Candidatus Dependentiae bacterium]MCC7414561.1 hypothetical protein [Campylobacterota bacterium]
MKKILLGCFVVSCACLPVVSKASEEAADEREDYRQQVVLAEKAKKARDARKAEDERFGTKAKPKSAEEIKLAAEWEARLQCQLKGGQYWRARGECLCPKCCK